MSERVGAKRDARLAARVIRCIPMVYGSGAEPHLDRPAHVRAASGLAWVGARLAVIQDDANFVALVDPATGEADAVPLPRGPGGLRQFDDARGNKADKLDLEAVTCVPGPDGPLLLALGSGSSPRRECVAVIGRLGSAGVTATVHHAPGFYARLRADERFAGSELNVEGVLHLPDRLRLFGRGNGAPRGALLPVDAMCDVAWPQLLAYLRSPEEVPAPAPANVVQYDLGVLHGVRLSFTDAALVAGGSDEALRTIYTAAAEASPDAIRDGAVAGSAIGVIAGGPRGTSARWTELTGEDGRPFPAKVEGVALVPGAWGRAFVAVDRDDPGRPSELCEVELTGPWI